ncbi:dual specificity protein phosphatase 9-like [Daphnia pulex]|uniref:dual specificity protein phosphatase 9-like n=1 Tax=Daphnia pulex TaxID=6669 RepID=UPI001EDEF46A|nr:dual specificity protein phosphatase 9-like [Daphnia pulex]
MVKMPAMSEMADCGDGVISADGLWAQLRDATANPSPPPPLGEGDVMTLLDCRSAADFGECHIRRAVHLSLPSIMLRRLAGGKVTISAVLNKSNNNPADGGPKLLPVRTPFLSPPTTGSGQGASTNKKQQQHTFVLCGGGGEIVSVLRKSLIQDGCPVVCLQGGVEEFRNKYPEWCVTRESETANPSEVLPNLRIGGDAGLRSTTGVVRPLSLNNRRPGSLGSRSASDSEEERPDSSLESGEIRVDDENGIGVGPPEFGSGFSLGLSVGLRLGLESEPLPPLMLDNVTADSADMGGLGAKHLGLTAMNDMDPLADPGFPVEILPHLFLGNAQNSRDCDALDKHRIRYVVNVTPNLPNVFEDSGTIQYLQIPITDHWSQNLASFFPSAIGFIDGARERQEGVLVHCLAGISRSVTITVAYLMYKMSMSLNDAYDFVRRKKSNISPNFNFMGQLLDFERQLNPPSPQRCTCHLSAGDSGNKPEDHAALIPFTRLSIEEPEDEEELPLSADPTSMGIDSGLPSSVSMSPCSAESSVASSPAVIHSSPSGGGGSGNVKRLRTLVCRCQASLSQCHFTTPTTL